MMDEESCTKQGTEREPSQAPQDAENRQQQEAFWSLATLATGSLSRLRGLLGKDYQAGSILLLPCCDIHTLGMRENIDVAFVDKSGQVLEAYRDVKPRRRLRNKSAVAVVERFATQELPWFEAGDLVGLSRHPAARADNLRKQQSASQRPSKL